MNGPFSFRVLHQSRRSRARVGQIVTPHGVIDTPNFVGVGTNGTLKSIDSAMAAELGLQLMFCNTYHLMLQPGTSVVREAGGLHQFIGRDLPIITDSGGFQVFSLAYGTVKDELKSRGQKRSGNLVLRINEEGVLFRSYRDGSRVLLTPETSVAAQKDLGADIIIPFDELLPYHTTPDYLRESLNRTHRWQKRSLDAHLANRNGQAMYAVIHGGVDPALRAESCSVLAAQPFDGFAIGGSLGKNVDEMQEMLERLMPQVPEDKPSHLLGIGDLPGIDASVRLGLDTFDSSYPTRCARHGLALCDTQHVKILHSEHRNAFVPLDVECPCPTCARYTRAYLHHLFKAREATGHALMSVHNIMFMVRRMARYREMILMNEI